MSGARLELTWPNKDRFLLVPKDADGKPIWVGRDHPAAHEVRLANFTDNVGRVSSDPHADNLLVTGDSLDVLRILREVPEFAAHYRGRVKLIYIDPPFNTGQTFTHYDDWMEHSTWLSFMRDRLLLMKDLLAPDGSLWVHLDDSEQHRMRCLMDEVFGAANFIATVVWEKASGAKGDTDFSTSHDYILIYAKTASSWKAVRNLLPRTSDQLKRYANPDDDPRGPWRQGADGTAKSGNEGLRFPVTTPSGKGRKTATGELLEVHRSNIGDSPERGASLVWQERRQPAGHQVLPGRDEGRGRTRNLVAIRGGRLQPGSETRPPPQDVPRHHTVLNPQA